MRRSWQNLCAANSDAGDTWPHCWTTHLHIITGKRSIALAYIRNDPHHLRKSVCEAYVGPNIEYASVIWNPHERVILSMISSPFRTALVVSLRHLIQEPVDLSSQKKKTLNLPALLSNRILALCCVFYKMSYSQRSSLFLWFSLLDVHNVAQQTHEISRILVADRDPPVDFTIRRITGNTFCVTCL